VCYYLPVLLDCHAAPARTSSIRNRTPWLSEGFSQSMRLKYAPPPRICSSRHRHTQIHSCNGEMAGCRSTPMEADRRSFYRGTIHRSETHLVMANSHLWPSDRKQCCQGAHEHRGSGNRLTETIRILFAPSISPPSFKSLDSMIGSENGSSAFAPGNTCSISNSGRNPHAIICLAQSSIGSPSSPQ
jgi:hypothetical protein